MLQKRVLAKNGGKQGIAKNDNNSSPIVSNILTPKEQMFNAFLLAAIIGADSRVHTPDPYPMMVKETVA